MIRSLTLIALLAASPAVAGGGIDFASMPVGCEWQVSHSDGQRWVETFMGKVKGKFRVEVRDAKSGSPVNVQDYNKDGLLIRRSWANGGWEAFKPFSCYSVPGACSYVYTTADGARLTIDSNVVQDGKGFVSSATPKGQAPYPEEWFAVGPFGILSSTKSQRYWTKTGHFRNCGPSV